VRKRNMKKVSVYLTMDQIKNLKKLSDESCPRCSWAAHLRQAVEDYVTFELDPESCGIDNAAVLKSMGKNTLQN